MQAGTPVKHHGRMKSAVIYYRVSTKRQGFSGLGLDAQRNTVEAFVKYNHYFVEAEFIEIESGKKNNRPVLQKALQHCKSKKSILLIAKLDRLSRNMAFISALMESNVEFMAVDSPNTEPLYLHIMAAFAEEERRMASIRTTAALKVAKERGVELGSYGKHVLSKENKLKAIEFALRLKPVIDGLNLQGITSIRKITKELNRRRIRTSSGGKWYASTVHTLLKRLKENEG